MFSKFGCRKSVNMNVFKYLDIFDILLSKIVFDYHARFLSNTMKYRKLRSCGDILYKTSTRMWLCTRFFSSNWCTSREWIGCIPLERFWWLALTQAYADGWFTIGLVVIRSSNRICIHQMGFRWNHDWECTVNYDKIPLWRRSCGAG